MMQWGLLLDGKYRENSFDAGVFNYTEKYSKSLGSSPDGLYCYNFSSNNVSIISQLNTLILFTLKTSLRS